MSKTTKGKKATAEKVSALTSLGPPWPVWTDAALNSEKWDAVIHVVDHLEKKPPSPEYEDPAGHGDLPASLVATAWTRAQELFPKLSVVENDKASPYDVISMNTHLLKSRLMQSLLSDISSLMYLAGVKPFAIEMQGPNYVPNGGAIWKPWHHIYANCKAGKGVHHKPGVNKVGKYVIRLFFLGDWRKIIVDDFIPVDESGKYLLPVTSLEGELWLPLLAKALVRIASFSWSDENEIVDFNVVTCLTGWLPQSFNCADIPIKYIWCICQKLLLSDIHDEKLKYSGIPQDDIARTSYAPPPVEGQRVPDPLYEMRTSDELEVLGSVAMFAVTSETPKLLQNEHTKSPYGGQWILITDADIYTASDRPPTPLWKKFRWKEWALRTGILKDADREVKRVKVFVPIRETGSPTQNDEDSESTSSASHTDDEKSKQNKKNKAKKNKKDKKKGGSKGSGKKSGKFSMELDEWLYLTDLIPYLCSLVVYYRPSSFDNVLTLSDMTLLEGTECKPLEATQGSEKGKHKKMTINCVPISPARDCLYHSMCFYVDDMCSKKVLFSLSILSDMVERTYHMRITKDKDSTQRVPVLENYHIVGEEYAWSNTGFGKVLFCLGTKGVKATLLQLREGACSMRIWLKVPRNFSLNILSQVPFTLGPLEKIQQLVGNISASTAYFGQAVAQSFAKLQKAAGKEYTEKIKQLQEFYASYQPRYFSSEYITRSATLIEEINCAFEKAMVAVLLQTTADDIDALTNYLKYLQQLFSKSNFGTDALRELNAEKAEAVNVKFEEELKALEQQSDGKKQKDSKESPKSPKGKKDKKGKEKKSPKSAGSSRKGKEKDRPCSFFENPEVCSELLLKMVKFYPSLLCLYPFRDELCNNRTFEEYRGVVKLSKIFSADGWQLIVRFIVNTHSEKNCLGALFFIASIKNFVFRVINNDTGQETAGRPFGSLAFCYSKNNNGYTFLAYGIPDPTIDKEIKWCLRIISYDMKCLLHRCPKFQNVASECKHLPPTQIVTKDLKDYYIPNSDRRICRCILTTTREQLLSLRFYFSNERVRFHVTLTELKSNETVIDTEGMGSILIPALLLEACDDDIELSAEESMDEKPLDQKLNSENGTRTKRPPIVFIAEAFVIQDSWYLTQEDKEKVRAVKDTLASSGLIDLSGLGSAISSATSSTQKRPSSRRRTASVASRSRAPSVASRNRAPSVASRSGTASVTSRSKSSSTAFHTTLVYGAPFWSLQVAVDTDRAGETTLEIDTEREEEIRQMKLQWERADPGRRKRAHALRDEFLEERSQFDEVPSETQQPIRSPNTIINGIIEEIVEPVGKVVVDEEFRDRLETSIKQSLEKLDHFREKMNSKHERLLWRQGHRNQLVEQDLLEKLSLSEQMQTTAYCQRSAYIEAQQAPQKNKHKKGKK